MKRGTFKTGDPLPKTMKRGTLKYGDPLPRSMKGGTLSDRGDTLFPLFYLYFNYCLIILNKARYLYEKSLNKKSRIPYCCDFKMLEYEMNNFSINT